MKDNIPKPVSAISSVAAKIAVATSGLALLLLAALHFIKPDLDPNWNTISEYAIGPGGWLMVVTFLLMAVSYAGLFWVLKSQSRTVPAKIGLALLLISVLGLTLGGLFVTDPIETPQTELSASGTLHGLGAGLASLLLPIAAAITGVSIARKNTSWAPVKLPLLVASFLPLLGLLIFMVTQSVVAPDGKFGPGVNIGWADRLSTLALGLWVVAVAGLALKLKK